jgi:hypothetical protein
VLEDADVAYELLGLIRAAEGMPPLREVPLVPPAQSAIWPAPRPAAPLPQSLVPQPQAPQSRRVIRVGQL